jgi:hypothetical protein
LGGKFKLKLFTKGNGLKYFSDKNSRSKKNLAKKSRADVFERRLTLFFLLLLLIVVAYTGIYAIGYRSDVSKAQENNYIRLSNAETGEKDAYGTSKDASGNTTAINGLVPISCYGDSFTNAPDSSTLSYPSVLSYKANRTVYNIAVNDETMYGMAARQGGIPAMLSPFTIRSDKRHTEVYLTNAEDMDLDLDLSKNGGLNPCKVDGVEGLISKIDGKYYFTRSDSGEEKIVNTTAQVVTRAMQLRGEDINVFFIGSDSMYDSPEKVVEIYQKIVDAIPGDDKKYLIVGPIKGKTQSIDNSNKALSEAFGDNYLDLRAYMTTQAAEDIGIELSEADTELAKGNFVPSRYFENSSLDSNFLSDSGAEAVGTAVYKRLDELGYLADNTNDTEENN